MKAASFDEVLSHFNNLPTDQQRHVADQVADLVKSKWVPNPGPQTEGYFSEADLLLYGGQGGGGKSDLLAGLALTQHKNSLLMRRQYTDLGAMIDRTLEINGSRQGYNGSPPPKLRTADGRLIDFGAAAKLGDEQHWQGHAHDFIGIDEATQFIELQIRFLMGWNRPRSEADIDQRCRTVLATNPPLGPEGDYIIGMFRPWLDPTHPKPARNGELRHFIIDPDGKDLEVDGPDDCRQFNGKVYKPLSRTFIPAQLRDNPTLARTNYQASLDGLPEPLRSAIRDGNFMTAREDSAYQVIPTAWVVAAIERWHKGKPENVPMTSMGLDVARGGRDNTVVAPRFDKWFAELISVPGKLTPDGPSVVALAVQHQRDGACINLDSIGVGGSVQDHLKSANLTYVPLNGAERSDALTRDDKFGFVTKRSEMWWKLREALDPDYGINIALPPDRGLQADLTAPTYSVRPGQPPKIYVENKDDIIKRLGRSPDEGDAVVYAWASGEVAKPRKPKKRRRSMGNSSSWMGG
ncbi:terminase [Pelagibius litoralis]|uniref:Terminase n=1 Tax=Pelagibius litoralis TaxID=374515 RepID=A0A967EVJ5_9PROT|nr:terminase [Pelagibius litoralis]NIA67924.1 terminase [Pelagibius litoralis]